MLQGSALFWELATPQVSTPFLSVPQARTSAPFQSFLEPEPIFTIGTVEV